MRQNPILFKRCPRDKGDLFYEEDRFGIYWDCLNCGQHYYTNGRGETVLELPRKFGTGSEDKYYSTAKRWRRKEGVG